MCSGRRCSIKVGNKDHQIKIGRRGGINDDSEYYNALILSNDYNTVSRIEKPHMTIFKKNDNWYAIDSSSAGSYLNNEKMDKSKEYKLKDNDLLKLSLGSKGVELIFIS